MRRAEGVVDVEVAELGERAREARIVLFLAAEEARVLEQQHLAVLASWLALSASSRIGGLDEDHLHPVSSANRVDTGCSEYFSSGFPLGRPRCDSTTGCAPRSSSSSIVGRAARMRVSSVIRPSLVERNVEIDANERALAAQLCVGQIPNGFLSHGAARLEAGPP